MGIQNMIGAGLAMLRNPENFGESLTFCDPNTKPKTETPVDGTVEFLGNDALVFGDSDETLEEGTVDVPITLSVVDNGWFVRGDGEELKVRGRGGRDQHTQTILVTRIKKQAVKIARRKGS